MEFIQGDILDKDIIVKYFKDADKAVHHLAGVTAKFQEQNPSH